MAGLILVATGVLDVDIFINGSMTYKEKKMSQLIVEVCKIDKLEKHPNADKLEIATVKGWNCIVGINNHKEGELVIFCPPDSVIPDDIIEQYKLEFLKKNGRVGTIKLRQYISQGLILSVPEGKNYKEGQDVSKELNIKKYEPPISSNLQRSGKQPSKKKRNPLFDKYTSIENIKNFNRIFKEGDYVIVTEKIHGTNFRAGKLKRYSGNIIGKILSFLFGKYEFVYGSHNIQLCAFNKNKNFYGTDVYGQIAKKYKLAEIIPEDYIIYGEIFGKKIQELEYEQNDIDLVVFDIKHKEKYLDWNEVVEFCLYNGLRTVPTIYIGKYRSEELNNYTEGNSLIAKNQIREGCVVKALTEENHPRIGRKILKSINLEYLCKKNRTEHH